MKNYRFFICYDGTRYDGWQRQGNTDKTIQGKIEGVLSRLFGVPVEIHGSGRTDAGVHAKAQVANVHLPSVAPDGGRGGTETVFREMEPSEIQRYLNEYLPEDICVYGLEETGERFHSRLSAVGKTYCYRIRTGERKPIFDRKYVWYLPEKLDAQAMRQAAGHLMGTHDFKSFCGNPKMKKSTVRTMDRLEILEEDRGVLLRFHGDGFLQNMVRILTGTLVEVGRGNMSPESMKDVLAMKMRSAAGPMAPAQGLWLESVEYEPPYRAEESNVSW